LSVGEGSLLTGILIGLFPPAPGLAPGGAGAALDVRPLRCIVIAPGGIGIFGKVGGVGSATIDFGDSFDRLFKASLSVGPLP
jgi:hypothetical protein